MEDLNPETVYVTWLDTPENAAIYADLIAQYDQDGGVAREKRTNYWIRDADAQKDEQGEYITAQNHMILLKEGKHYYGMSEFHKAEFDSLEESGGLDGFTYTKPNDIYIYINNTNLVPRIYQKFTGA